MKHLVGLSVFFFLLAFFHVQAQTESNPITQNIFIITTDGFRWQEIFHGADSLLLAEPAFNADTSLSKDLFWDQDLVLRRKKLLPFFWNTIAVKGRMFGSREEGNKMNVKNVFKISYPGYSELLSGFPDPLFIPNLPIRNRNITILEALNQLPAFKGKVAAFSSWNVLPYIVNERRSGIPVNGGYEPIAENGHTDQLINEVQASVEQKGHTRHDWLTYLSAKEFIRNKHPRLLFLGLGETDEAAHAGHYDDYLRAANMLDKMISDLWFMCQTDPFYRGRTTFIITTDHGRGAQVRNWTKHGTFTAHSGETWMALLGPGAEATAGTETTVGQFYSCDIPSTIQALLGTQIGGPSFNRCPLLQGKQPLYNAGIVRGR